MKVIEAIKVVESIYNEIADYIDEFQDIYMFDLSYSTNGYAEIISYCGQVIWSSEDDDREIMLNGEPEHLEGFIINKMNEINRVIGNLYISNKREVK